MYFAKLVFESGEQERKTISSHQKREERYEGEKCLSQS